MLFVNSHNHIQGTEEFRTLRSRLYQIRDRQPLRTLLIASVLPGEGKTFTTANLSQAIVRQHERRALVIDADLRRSQLHVYFGAPGTPGLTDYLSGEADEFSIIQRGPTDNLFFIPGGKLISNPAELLANGRMKILLDRLAPVFDWILVDSPPAVAVSDASLLADLCDGVLLVIQAAKTPFDAAQKAREEFRNKRLLGVVLNRVEPGEGYQACYYSYYKSHPDSTKGKG
jgi:capsular exopolysaccharide synthesis family protein